MKKKKIFLTITIFSMLLGMLGVGSTVVKADNSNENTRTWIDLGFNGIDNPMNGDDSSYASWWSGNFITFGNYDGKPIYFKVLDNNSTDFGQKSILLDAENALGMFKNHDNVNGVEFNTYKQYLNNNFINKSFTTYENNAINISSKNISEDSKTLNGLWSQSSYIINPDENGYYSYTNPAINNEKVFILSAEELSNSHYGFNSDIGAHGTVAGGNTKFKFNVTDYEGGAGYLTRSMVKAEDSSLINTTIRSSQSYSPVIGITPYNAWSPAMNINPDSVIFNCPDWGKKIALASLIEIPSSVKHFGRWKLTLKDDKDFSDNAFWDTSSNQVLVGDNITIKHLAPSTVNSIYNNVTAVILNEEGTKILYYGSVNTDMNSESSTITVPENLALGNYKLRLYGEQWNEMFNSDYGSKIPFETTINVIDKLEEKVNISYDWLDSGVEGVDLPEAEEIVKDSEYASKELNVEGYVFDGWYTDQEGKNKFINGTKINKDTILYGKLKKQIPLTPLEPSKPIEKPNIPLVPLEPSIPIEKPTIPLTPLGPSTSSTNVAKEPVNTNTVQIGVQTGDKTNSLLYIGILLSSAIVLSVICYKSKKTKNIK